MMWIAILLHEAQRLKEAEERMTTHWPSLYYVATRLDGRTAFLLRQMGGEE